MNGTDSKQSAGYFREKAIIGLSSLTGDEMDKSIMKVTSHMLKAPKEKYMQSLLAASYGHTKQYQKNGLPINEYIVRELEKRSHTHNWVVVLKTMVVLHRLLTDGSDDMVALICRYRNMFSARNIKELGDTAAGAAQKYFIEEYMRYLEERAASQVSLGFNRRIETREFDDHLNSLNVADLIGPFDALMNMLGALLQINYREAIIDNFCTMEAYQNVIRDGKTIFQLLSKRIIFVLSGFEDLPLSLKKMWLQEYTHYDVAAAKLKELFDSMNRSSRAFAEPIPQLKPMPESLLRRLEQEVDSAVKPQVESLASLGISSEEPRVEKEERLPPPPQAPARTQVSAPARDAAPPTKPAAPPKPAFTMDDLFQPAPVPPPPTQRAQADQQQQQQQQSVGQYGYGNENMVSDFGGNPASGGAVDAWSTGAPTTNAGTDWSTGAPTSWSTGAPELPQPQYDSQPFGNTQQPAANYYPGSSAYPAQSPNPLPPSQQQQQPAPSKLQDPFRDLYSQSQQQWH